MFYTGLPNRATVQAHFETLMELGADIHSTERIDKMNPFVVKLISVNNIA